ncbi:MAG: 50S ribosomal protein L11 methyltransferase [Desulfobacterales bacterium]
MTRNLVDPRKPPSPYHRLFIYYLEGRVAASEPELGPDFIGNWQENGSSFLFFSEPMDDAVERLVSRTDGLELIDRYTMSYEDWLGERFEGFETGRLAVRPPWTAVAPGGSKIDVLLDPGVVFGSGTHTTTRDCLSALQEVFRLSEPQTVLDLGSGTGLLSVAAARLGAKRVLAVDLNLLAVQTTLRNIRLNHMAPRVLAVQGRAETFIESRTDLLIANIHFDIMKDLVAASGFTQCDYFILSGLLRSEARVVEGMLSRLPVRLLEQWGDDGVWHTFLGRRR